MLWIVCYHPDLFVCFSEYRCFAMDWANELIGVPVLLALSVSSVVVKREGRWL